MNSCIVNVILTKMNNYSNIHCLLSVKALTLTETLSVTVFFVFFSIAVQLLRYSIGG